MLELRRYLKPFVLNILLVVVLLFLQANCELSLPDYMSKIVNVGIANNGIQNAVSDFISEDNMFEILENLSEEDKDIVLSNYTRFLGEAFKEHCSEDYPELKDLDESTQMTTFCLTKKDKSTIEQLDNILAEAESDIYYKNNNIDIPENQTKEDREASIKNGAIGFVKDEYARLGIELKPIQMKYILKSGGIMLFIAFFSLCAVVCVTLVVSRMVASISKNIRNDLFRKVVSFSSSEINKFSTSSLITRCTNDVQQIQMMLNMVFRVVIYAPIIGIGGIIKVMRFNKNMSFIVFISVIVIMICVAILFAFATPKFKIVQNFVDRLNLVTRESLTGMMVIRAFNTEKSEEEKFDKANTDLTNINLFVTRLMGSMQPAMMLIMNITTVAILWFGAVNVSNNTIQVGEIMAFIQYAMQIMFSFLMISIVSIMLPRASVSANRINEVLSCDISIVNPENPKEPLNNKRGVVEFKNVSFKYPDADECILEDISFTAMPGETIAFIGSTGSGKSTLINLIPRFYDITKGEIKVGGVNIKEMSLKSLRSKIGLIPQKAMLFKGTIESNLKFGDKEVSDKDMIKAAEISQSKDFIMSKDKQFDEPISQGGTNVSGGQRQRLAIGRAIANNSEILIFDDSFSALDYATDKKLRNSLAENLKDRTIMIVAQRISTIRNAEQIIVLDEGKIVGKGKHKELLKNCEVYKQIASSQLSKEELDNE